MAPLEDEQVQRRCESLARQGLSALINEARNFAQGVCSGPVSDKSMLGLWEHRDKIADLVDKETVCKKGCSYCCHMAVGVSTFEAEVIRTVTGRQLADVPLEPALPETNVKKYMGVPCPFLKDGECSIYDARPTACRTFSNLSDDPELCNLEYCQDVPSIDFRWYWAAEAFVTYKLGMTVADIREWFPEK